MKTLALLLSSALLALSAVGAEAPASFKVGAFNFQRPPAWEWIAVSSPMRKAQLKVPGADAAQAADITFFFFGNGMGGDTNANAQRWLKQFDRKEDADKVESLKVGDVPVTLVSTEGTFNSGMPGGPTSPLPNQALLGAILEHADGPVFVKMTGPAELVKSSREPFLAFLKTAVQPSQP